MESTVGPSCLERMVFVLRVFSVLGAVFAGVAVAAGAFGAHTLKATLTPAMLDVFETGLNTGLHLVPTVLLFEDFTRALKVRAASTGYFRISGTTRPATAVRARDLADLALPSTMQYWVVRLQ